MIKFISQLSEEKIIGFANRLTGRTDKPKIVKELNRYISACYKDYHGGHYESEIVVKFNDRSYILDNQGSTDEESRLWGSYVYINLPKEVKHDYANLWNVCSEEDLTQYEFYSRIVASQKKRKL